jgi:hypothetical protein
MLQAILVDLRRIPDCDVVTTWDRRLGEFLLGQIESVVVDSLKDEADQFRRLASEADFSLVIAPEFDSILADRRRLIDETAGHWPGCTVEAIELCSDKWALFEHLNRHQIPTVPTSLWDPSVLPSLSESPCVIKPRDGAGSSGIRVIEHPADIPTAIVSRKSDQHVIQPCIAGRAISVAVLCASHGANVEIFPTAEQHLSHDGQFRYLGGRLPITTSADHEIEELVRQACHSLPGLNGYVGFDLILPDNAPQQPLIVEINPRLTTSYSGYRQLTDENLAVRMLHPDATRGPISWKSTSVEWMSAGRVASNNEYANVKNQPDAQARDASETLPQF